jgi:hypothetical protein
VAGLTRRGGVLVRAAGEQRNQNHQIGQRKQPLVGLRACGFRCACKKTQVTPAREVVQMLHADSRQAGNFGFCKYFLTGFYRNHLMASHILRSAARPLTL